MLQDAYQVKSVLPFYTQRIDGALERFKPKKAVWLGFSPIALWLYDRLDRAGIELRIADNNKKKQGIRVILPPGYEDRELYVESVEDCAGDREALFLVGNIHHPEYVEQLQPFGVEPERVIDLYQNDDVLLDYYSEEVRELLSKGYRPVSGRELQLRENIILKWFRDFCEANDLFYYLHSGTLLGAVRHGGFIPWDDDVDVLMPYEDYCRFMEIVPGDGRFRVADYRFQDSYQWQFAKLMDTETYMLHNGFTDVYFMGINIDIFPFCGYPSEPDALKKKIDRSMELDWMWQTGFMYYRTGITDNRDYIEKVNAEKFALSAYDGPCTRSALVWSGRVWATPSEDFFKRIRLSFEGEEYYGPSNYDLHLRNTYGDYMQLPPEEKRKRRNYPAYARG